MPKVSVVIPIYNVEKYLRECLDSIVNQSLKDIEIICVNDGSTDGSLEILKEYEQKDPRVKVIDKKNEGAGIARNVALDIATGEYLAFIDSDDFVEQTMLEQMFNLSLENDLDVSICRSFKYDTNSHNISSLQKSIDLEDIISGQIFDKNDIPKKIIGFCVGWPWDKLFRRSFIEKYELRFPDLKNSEDAYFVFMALVLAQRISYTDEHLVYHRNHSGSLSLTRDNNPLEFIKGAYLMKSKLEESGLYDMLEQSFLNWFVSHSFWQIDSVKKAETKKFLDNELRTKVFADFLIRQKSLDYFYEPFVRSRLQQKSLIKKIPWYQKVFSVKHSENKEYKIIWILGFKISLKR